MFMSSISRWRSGLMGEATISLVMGRLLLVKEPGCSELDESRQPHALRCWSRGAINPKRPPAQRVRSSASSGHRIASARAPRSRLNNTREGLFQRVNFALSRPSQSRKCSRDIVLDAHADGADGVVEERAGIRRRTHDRGASRGVWGGLRIGTTRRVLSAAASARACMA